MVTQVIWYMVTLLDDLICLEMSFIIPVMMDIKLKAVEAVNANKMDHGREHDLLAKVVL